MTVVELVAGGLLLVAGIRSLLRWLGTDFDASSGGELVLFTVHATTRVGMWFAFAGLFVGYAVVDEPQRFVWYSMVPIVLAGVQLLTAQRLARAPRDRPSGRRDEHGGG